MAGMGYLSNIDVWEAEEGAPTPHGATWVESLQAWNFSISSHHATAVSLLLYSEADVTTPIRVVKLDRQTNKTGRTWHVMVTSKDAPGAKYFAWRLDGPWDPGRGLLFDKSKVLVDPFARRLHFPESFSRDAASQVGRPNDGQAVLGVLPHRGSPFDWSTAPGPHHTHDTIVYEVHVRGFTARANSGVADDLRGTFLGLIEKIPYLVELGVTVVELLPVHQFDPQEGNYWGYMTLNFFAPHSGYAHTDGVAEFRQMVAAMHRAGIEVWLDVVYNHTAEGSTNGPTYNLRGIDNSTYYLLNADGSYNNDSGCGNTIRSAHPAARTLILRSLRYWATEMGVDGFRFDLASILARNMEGQVRELPAIVSEISNLAGQLDIKLVAEAWDLGAYLLGRAFPGIMWRQWNGRYRDDIRGFVRGDAGLVSALMTRVYGSDDLFPDGPGDTYRPYQSINFITAHDGFSLYDLVSYNNKHNQANGHNNTDGTDDNRSWNCGWEGDDGAPADVLALRHQQIRNFATLLMVSNGVPMIVAGDEFGNTQGGNNNPYNQDNETTWLDWDLLNSNRDLFKFWANVISMRKKFRTFARSQFWRGDLHWFGVSGAVDLSADSRSVGWFLRGDRFNEPNVCVLVNAWSGDLTFDLAAGLAELPDRQHLLAGPWLHVVDTADAEMPFRDPGTPLAGTTCRVPGRSISVLFNPQPQ